MNKDYREFRLANGLLVALQKTPAHTINGQLRVHHGALHERPGEEGIAHLLEHALMNGGSKNYTPEQGDDLRDYFGNRFNAGTALEMTIFEIDTLADDLELFLDLVSDLSFNPRIDQIRLTEEIQRVLRETNDAKSNPTFKHNLAHNHAVYRNNIHTYEILGDESVVENATPQTVKEFHKRGYHVNNMQLILAGGFPDNVEELIRKFFEDRPQGEGKPFELPIVEPLHEQSRLHFYAPELKNRDNPGMSSAALSLTMVVPNLSHEDSYVLHIIGNILRGRLFKQISQRRGLAYHIGGGYSLFENIGIFSIGANILATQSDTVIEAIFDEMDKMKTELITDRKMEIFKRNLRYGFIKENETNNGCISNIKRKLQYDITPESYLAEVSKLTPEIIRDVSRKYLPDRKKGNYVLMFRDPLKE